MSRHDFSFRISHKENIGEYSVTATAGVILDEKLCEKYSKSAIEKAKQLKAKHGEKYSDEYYLDYGKSLVLHGIIAANKEIHDYRRNNCAVKDVDWAIYSYDEILEMESIGYEIPEEILCWAHAQHEADVVDYVMVSDSMVVEDNTTDATGTASDELSNLKKKAQQNITKSDKALKNAEQNVVKYNEIADKAKQIKEKKEDTYKSTMEEISAKTEEWKELDDKKKSGKLTKSEEKKYKDLSKQLNGTNGTLMKEIQADDSELDTFLTSLSDLNEDISENLIIAQNTVKAGEELGAYNKNYNLTQLPIATKGSVFDGNGNSFDTLYGVKSYDEISKLAIEKGNDLNEFSENLQAELTNNENTELSEFANNYTSLASQTEENTKNAMGDEFEPDTQQNNKSTNSKNYNVATTFSYTNSIIATATTVMSTADLMSKDTNVTQKDKQLQKELKTAQKDSEKLTKETATANTKLAKNQTEEEEFLTELEMLQDTQPEENTNVKPSKNIQTADDSKQDATSIISQLAQNQDEKISLKDLVKNTAIKSSSSTLKGEKLTKVLTNQNNTLKTRNKNAKEVAEKTQIVGVGTMATGVINTAIGTALQSTGATLMSNPFTFSEGVVLFNLGINFQIQGEKELTFGGIAVGTGAIGLASSDTADNTNKDANTTIKEANQIFKINNQEIKESSEITDENSQTAQSENEIQTNTPETDSQTDLTQVTDAETSSIPEVQPTEETPANDTTQTIEINEETEQDETTAQAEDSTADSSQEQQKDSKTTDSVSIEFNTPNALKAISTASKATSGIVTDRQEMNKLSSTVTKETKQSENLIKNIDTTTAKAVIAQNEKLSEAENLSQQQSEAQDEIQNAQTEEEMTYSQSKIENITTQLDANLTKDAQEMSTVDKTISNSVQQLKKFRNNTKTMDKDLSELNKDISTQSKISQKTLAVGIGTTGVGIMDINQGIGLIISGLSLMSNPFTYSIGAMQVAQGTLQNIKGITETASGSAATITGVEGLVENNITNNTSKDAKATLKEADTLNKELEKKAGDSSKEINENQTSETNDNNQVNQPENQQEENDEDVITLSASASSNSNTNDSTLTDDKADRKLSRFNTESIIESKKKRKKVQAIFAISGNKT